MSNRKYQRNIYNRKVSFSAAAVDYMGTIDNISPDGVHIITETAVTIGVGDTVMITLASADMGEDVKKAKIIWADESGFGAKFKT